eukprot:jgi/Tetstr1/423892/TSEL_014515.t1
MRAERNWREAARGSVPAPPRRDGAEEAEAHRAGQSALKEAAPWKGWRPLSAHLDRASAARAAEEAAFRPISARRAQSSLLNEYQRTLGCTPVSHSVATGALTEASKTLAACIPKRGLRTEIAAMRPKSAVEYLEMRKLRYGYLAEEGPHSAGKGQLRDMVAKHEETARIETIGVRPKPPVSSSDEDSSDEESHCSAASSPSQALSRSSSGASQRPHSSKHDPQHAGHLSVTVAGLRAKMGAEPSPVAREAERPTQLALLPPEPWNVRPDKGPSRRAVVINRPTRGEATDWKGVPLRPKTAPAGRPRPGLPPPQRYPRAPPGERPRRVPTLPLQARAPSFLLSPLYASLSWHAAEVESAKETLQHLGCRGADPRLAAHFSMDMERVTRSRQLHDAGALAQLASGGGSRVTYRRARFESVEVEEAVLCDTMEVALFRVLQGRDGLLADLTKLPDERRKLRAALIQLMPLLERMFAHYCQQAAPGGPACPASAPPVDEVAVQGALAAGGFRSMKSLIDCEMTEVREEEVRVESSEVDQHIDIGDFEDLESYEEAREKMMRKLMDDKRRAREAVLRAEMEALQEELLSQRPLEGPLLTMAQFWRCLGECRMSSTDTTLAAINRLVAPPSLLLANTLDEMAAGRDFRAGYKSNNDAVHASKMGSLVGVVQAAAAAAPALASASTRKNLAAAVGAGGASVSHKLRHGAPGKADRLPSSRPGALPALPNPAPSMPTVRGVFSSPPDSYPCAMAVPQQDLVITCGGQAEQARSSNTGALRMMKAIRNRSRAGMASSGGVAAEAAAASAGEAAHAKLAATSSPRLTPRMDDTGAAAVFTLEMLLDAEQPYSPYAAGLAHQRARLMDFTLFSESVIRVLHARYSGKANPSVAACVMSGLKTHFAHFEKAVQLAEEEAARVASLPPPASSTEEGEGEGEGTPPPPAPPLVVPTNVVQWKQLMASAEIQEVIRTRQTRLMKCFLHFGQDVTDITAEEKLMGGPVMSYNDFLSMLEASDVMDAQLDPRRVRDIFQEVTGVTEVVASRHKNNRNTELIYDEFQELIVRCAMVVRRAGAEGAQAADHVQAFLDGFVFACAATLIPGRF